MIFTLGQTDQIKKKTKKCEGGEAQMKNRLTIGEGGFRGTRGKNGLRGSKPGSVTKKSEGEGGEDNRGAWK